MRFFGIKGPAISIAVMSLAINLIMSSGFIMLVKTLAKDDLRRGAGAQYAANVPARRSVSAEVEVAQEKEEMA